MRRMLTDAEWVDSRIGSLPSRWARRLRKRWERRQRDDYRGANIELREATTELLTVRIPLDASDRELCDAADVQAACCAGRAQIHRKIAALRESMERVCHGQGIKPPLPTVQDGPAMARMCCSRWWRRKLRKHQGQVVETEAVRLGYVSRDRDLYVSNERLAARLQQHARNAATLEATTARNEDGEEFTLAELAAKSTANKSIRRSELMTRISGFERYADRMGHVGLFVTITCPSRFHRYMTVNDGKSTVTNGRYDPKESPKTGHRYLQNVWACIRSDLKRRSIVVYGFRIAEPQHDATPHLHLLLFVEPGQREAAENVYRKHALKDSPDEPGAAKHRCDVKLIDKSRGSAAAYVAKYVAKNIDGEHVGQDLSGKPAIESAKRVEAWASNWSIRQFQQIGGPPVGVWRELRRITKLPADAPEHLHKAHRAANKLVRGEDEERATVAWDDYCVAQGGVGCGRKPAITLAMRPTDSPGLYGDSAAMRPYGIQTEHRQGSNADSKEGEPANQSWTVESERRKWSIDRPLQQRVDWRLFAAERAQPVHPWTRVNNCTSLAFTDMHVNQDVLVDKHEASHSDTVADLPLSRRSECRVVVTVTDLPSRLQKTF